MSTPTYPSWNDKEYDLLKKMTANTALIADYEIGDVASVAGTASQILVNGGTVAATGNVTLSLPSTLITPGNITVAGGTVGTAASTNLTLNGGSSGANLVLGSGTNGAATVTSNGSGRTTFTTPRTNAFGQLFTNSGTVAANDRVGFLFGFNGIYANSGIAAQILDNGSTGAEDVVIYSGTNATGAVEVARFKNTGNLLIGTTVDSSGLLQIGTNTTTAAGGMKFGTDVSVYRSNTRELTFLGASTSTFIFAATALGSTVSLKLGDGTNNDQGIIESQNGTLVFKRNATTALTLDASQNATFAGQVNSGTSSSSGYNNNYNVQLEGLVGRIIVNKNSASSSGTLFAGFGRNGSGLGSITQDGTTGVLYNTTSDARLKENVRDVTNSGVIIDALKPCVFDWKNDGDKNRFGFLAQEVHAVFPQAVKKGDDGEEVTDAWAMDAAKLVPVLVAELKALRARVSALEN